MGCGVLPLRPRPSVANEKGCHEGRERISHGVLPAKGEQVKTLRSGFCGLGMPIESHARCSGVTGEYPCPCDCHEVTDEPETADSAWVVREPGVFLDMPEGVYHADPCPDGSMSSSMAKALTTSTPAHLRGARRKSSQALTLGTLMHECVLRDGDRVEVLDFKDRRSKAYADSAAELEAAGKVPVLASEMADAKDAATVLAKHPVAGLALRHGAGDPEVSGFTRHHSGLMLRARADYLRSGQGLIVDYKTTSVGASLRDFTKSAHRWGYHQQDAWYSAVFGALLGREITFVFVVQEATPPYEIAVYQYGDEERHVGHQLNEKAIETYNHCRESGSWPGYPHEVQQLTLPKWAYEGGLS